MPELPFYEDDGQRSLAQLLSLRGAFREDSLVMAIRDRLQRQARGANYTKVEFAILAIEELEDQVNSGGFSSFFDYSPECVAPAIEALKAIGCPHAASIVERAVQATGKEATDVDGLHHSEVNTDFDALDAEFQQYPDPIVERLLDYIAANATDVKVDIPATKKSWLQRLFPSR
ncbi:MAG: DUF4375 domain-containing protein [Armatimonadetes bacterium]|nr:DUF4375 domain-containing protein [Armatimonadota bacterium]